MNKILPIIMVIAFWALFYIGNKYPGTGEVIALCSIIIILMCILYGIKAYLKKSVMNNK